MPGLGTRASDPGAFCGIGVGFGLADLLPGQLGAAARRPVRPLGRIGAEWTDFSPS